VSTRAGRVVAARTAGIVRGTATRGPPQRCRRWPRGLTERPADLTKSADDVPRVSHSLRDWQGNIPDRNEVFRVRPTLCDGELPTDVEGTPSGTAATEGKRSPVQESGEGYRGCVRDLVGWRREGEVYLMEISGIEVAAGLAWLAGVGVAVWALRAHRVTGSESALLLAVLTVVPLLGPVAAVLFVSSRRHPTNPHPPGAPTLT
jgi:hypothetical protein